MNDAQERREIEPPPAPDRGHRQMFTYVFIALALALLIGAATVYLVIRWFDTAT